MTDNTILRLIAVNVPPYSARRLRQTLQPIGASAQMRRTIDGVLVDIADSAFRKFGSTISGSDVDPPAISGVWPGLHVTVHCISRLCYETSTGGADRPIVPGSESIEGDFTFYRPILEMRIINYRVDTDEWGAVVSWSMDLEEV